MAYAQVVIEQPSSEHVIDEKSYSGQQFFHQKQNAAKSYQREDLMNLTPVEVIKRLYDIAILAIKKDDVSLAHRAINELIVGLDFKYEELATGLFRLYQYSKSCLREGNKAEAVNTLEELRATWVEAFKL